MKVMGAALNGQSNEVINKVFSFYTRMQQKEIEMIMSIKISSGETDSARVKIVEKVRKMEDEMKIDLTHFAPECSIKNARAA